ncbi:transcriptional regulator [Thermaurantimonas aggregans]|uniref:Transcriptional regulator n=1 Tax=Thermaurantimonas aggregans TaxID=2173829 RepID=A0A401XK45_9FLAO|nr:ArsR family transcriptional regulator [Thermaurantimonas aggregans]MCX8148566.1 ArsR family transcriptional regulator [Thermaurantimonas aggregans]GCD77360.1 transcriptional regulator [Thermaurantimonas aggregans]
MLETLISSKTRIKLLLKFFLNTEVKGYLRGLEAEFGESSNAIRLELNKLEEAGMLVSETQGNKKLYSVNKNHPLFQPVYQLIRTYVGIDTVIERVIERLGNVSEVYLTGSFARGVDADRLDIALIGQNIDVDYLEFLTQKATNIINRQIYTSVFSDIESLKSVHGDSIVLIYKNEEQNGRTQTS